jgi:hypothetical protein
MLMDLEVQRDDSGRSAEDCGLSSKLLHLIKVAAVGSVRVKDRSRQR